MRGNERGGGEQKVETMKYEEEEEDVWYCGGKKQLGRRRLESSCIN